jgi:hypothetical protein
VQGKYSLAWLSHQRRMVHPGGRRLRQRRGHEQQGLHRVGGAARVDRRHRGAGERPADERVVHGYRRGDDQRRARHQLQPRRSPVHRRHVAGRQRDRRHSLDFQGSDGSHGSLAVPIDVSNPTVTVNATYGFGSVAHASCADSGSAQPAAGGPTRGRRGLYSPGARGQRRCGRGNGRASARPSARA